MLTGSIPNIFDGFTLLTVLSIQHNLLTGPLPNSISHASSLNLLFVQDNRLSGSLVHVFNASYQRKLTTVQLSGNHFTGELPEQLFLTKSLVSVSAVSNCFHGRIPSSICLNEKLITLALDGLGCASSCRNKILTGISSSYISSRSITGGIPDCLWSLSKLKVLHLSGNGLSGTLPSDGTTLSSSLKDLSLSYNLLTGSIPSNIQSNSWTKLDLSHNRLSGTLDSKFSSTSKNTSLFLTDNRLSGSIPGEFHNMINIGILEGNLYGCNYGHSDLPSHDDRQSIYECGSNIFNVLYYIWLGIIVIICMVVYMLSNYRKKFTELIILFRQWIDVIFIMATDYDSKVDGELKKKLLSMAFLQRYVSTHAIIRIVSLYTTIFIVIILLPIYTILSTFYRTHTSEYAWTVALMYLSGRIAFGVAMCSLIVFIVILIVVTIISFTNSTYKTFFIKNMNEIQNEPNGKVNKIWPAFLLYALVNLIIVGSVNIGYVLVELYQNRTVSILCQILLSIFKLLWNNLVSPAMIRKMVRVLNINDVSQQNTLFFLQFVILIFNIIIIPCLMVMIISPNCFYNVFQPESDVTSAYFYTLCSRVNQNGACITHLNVHSSTTYSPPFIYSYQCSSDFITYYSPVFVFVCILSTFIFPLIQVLWIRWKLPNILSRIYYPNDESEVTKLMYIDQVYKEVALKLTLVGLLITFGAIFPPLAVAFLLNILVSSYSHQAMIGRFVMTTKNIENYSNLDMLEENLKVQPMLLTIQNCAWFLLYTSCGFYTLFLFDILGDSVGFYKAYWVLIVMPCIPLSIHSSYMLIEWIIAYRRRSQARRTASDAAIQLNPLVRFDATNLNRDSSIIDIQVDDRYSESIKI